MPLPDATYGIAAVSATWVLRAWAVDHKAGDAVNAIFLRTQRKDLTAVLSHQNGVLKLSRRQLVSSGYCPAIVTIDTAFVRADVNHWLNGKGHTGLKWQEVVILVVQHSRLVVEDLIDTVATVIAHNGEAGFISNLLDGSTDVHEVRASVHGLNTSVEGLLRDLYQALIERGGLTDDKGLRGVS